MKKPTDLEKVFNQCFLEKYNTLLVGGAEEPLYEPASNGSLQHCLYYREDFFSSALHEIAHWCIAGAERRLKTDFGYWYQPDGRSREEQTLFEKVEIKPQALEWVFSTAAGIPFSVSVDNLSSDDGEAKSASATFLSAVEFQALEYCANGLPLRAQVFVEALQAFYKTPTAINEKLYKGRLAG